TGLTNLVGSGSGNFRYNSNASSTGYNSTAAALGAGTYAVYREQPIFTVTANNVSSTYGSSPSVNVTNSTVNGDTLSQIYGSGNEPTTSIDGNTSSAGFYTAGTHNISFTSANANILGYASPTLTNGTLTVDQATLTVTGTQVANTTYNNSTVASFSNNGSLTGVLSNATSSVSDGVTVIASGNFSSKNAGNNLSVAMTSTLTGDDAANYVLTQETGITGNITPKNVTLSLGNVSKVYSGNTSYTADATDLSSLSSLLGVAGDSVTGITLSYNNKNVGTGKTLSASAANISSGNGNYNISYTDTTDSAITRLSSVTWTGGATGNWFDAGNWAGGAVPDLSNVETVIIPTGVSATFGNASASAVNITGLQASAATLYQANGTLNIGSGGVTLNNFTQASGNLSSTGDMSVSILSGTGGNITIGTGSVLNVTQAANTTYAGKIIGGGSFFKAGTGTLTLSGANTFTGGANISAGKVIAGNSNPSSSFDDSLAVYVND
ncbi:YDG domain-containing protein, partial [Polynucleobacter sp. es-MAR-4]|uniref:autotransporter outer membrane beta-barrel domain-containing protein n=1 Tax=Polynucleobacter sp. es-MAR-4 TaxID=1855655 RepID=UPI001C0BC57D